MENPRDRREHTSDAETEVLPTPVSVPVMKRIEDILVRDYSYDAKFFVIASEARQSLLRHSLFEQLPNDRAVAEIAALRLMG